MEALTGCIKDLISGADQSASVRILAAAVFGSAPSYNPSSSSDSPTVTPFECRAEHMVGLFPSSLNSACLALDINEYDELWQNVWSMQPSIDVLFNDNGSTKNDIFCVTSGQVSDS